MTEVAVCALWAAGYILTSGEGGRTLLATGDYLALLSNHIIVVASAQAISGSTCHACTKAWWDILWPCGMAWHQS